jgi:hypothetical protein
MSDDYKPATLELLIDKNMHAAVMQWKKSFDDIGPITELVKKKHLFGIFTTTDRALKEGIHQKVKDLGGCYLSPWMFDQFKDWRLREIDEIEELIQLSDLYKYAGSNLHPTVSLSTYTVALKLLEDYKAKEVVDI